MSKAVGSAEIACLLVRCCSCNSVCLLTCWVAGFITERYLSSSVCSLWMSSSFWSSSSSSSSMSASRCRSSSIFSWSAYWRSRKVPISLWVSDAVCAVVRNNFILGALPSTLDPLPSTFTPGNFIRHEQIETTQPAFFATDFLAWLPARIFDCTEERQC